MKVLGLIPARGGSKGIPRKNLRVIAGRPLIAWTIKAAVEARVLDRIVVSTEDDEIEAVARSLGADIPFTRPDNLASDEAPMLDVVVHVLLELMKASYRPDLVMILQPTAPLRRPQHIRKAIALLGEADSVCSVVEIPRELSPHYVMRINESGYLCHFLPEGATFTRRQDVPVAYRRDGTVYLVRSSTILEQRSLYGGSCVPLVLESTESLTIDDPADLLEAEKRLSGESWA